MILEQIYYLQFSGETLHEVSYVITDEVSMNEFRRAVEVKWFEDQGWEMDADDH